MSKHSGPSRVSASDPNFNHVITQWLEDIGSDVSDIDEPYSPLQSDHDTRSIISSKDSDSNSTESEDNSGSDVPRYFSGRNKFKWSSSAPARNVRTPTHNIVLKVPGLRGIAKGAREVDAITAWNFIFSADMVSTVVMYTNVKLQESRATYGITSRLELKDCDVPEMTAFLGLLVYSAVFKSNHENITSLFATDGTGREIFRAVMSAKRFATLLACLRFDNKLDRNERKKTDPAAAVSELVDIFNRNSQAVFSLGTCVTVDEMLVSFRGRCVFKMYIPSKPAKYGIKLQCLTDARNHFAYNIYIYCGKGTDGLGLTADEKKFPVTTQAILRLCKPIFGTNRNVTADNWYTSVPLVEILKKNGLTYVGTMRKNKKEIPDKFLPSKSRDVGTSLYGFTKDMTLLSFVPKKGKAVVLISSMHHSKNDDPETGKPEIISFYNSTKGGVDSLDQMCANYSCGRRTQRWPMAVFLRIVDIAAVNAYVLHQSYKDRTPLTRLQFMKMLGKQLTQQYLVDRMKNARLPRELRETICRITGNELQPLHASCNEDLSRANRKTCNLCPAKIKRKTQYSCFKCNRPICLQCSKKVCVRCTEECDTD